MWPFTRASHLPSKVERGLLLLPARRRVLRGRRQGLPGPHGGPQRVQTPRDPSPQFPIQPLLPVSVHLLRPQVSLEVRKGESVSFGLSGELEACLGPRGDPMVLRRKEGPRGPHGDGHCGAGAAAGRSEGPGRLGIDMRPPQRGERARGAWRRGRRRKGNGGEVTPRNSPTPKPEEWVGRRG